ncbi:membrane protein [Streptomyces cirratus]|uniref:Membrane protein n=2 Tax=Streptomyces TaxID=1883 RepID=A0ABQ3F2I6_9ACTN|nr:membrane protein [Streptomyces cirratus]
MSLKPSATIRYTAMRLGIFVGCLVLVAVFVRLGWVPAGLGDANFAWIVLLALVLSAPLSFVLLRKQRDEMSAQISGRVAGAKQKLAENRGQEDAADDAARVA